MKQIRQPGTKDPASRSTRRHMRPSFVMPVAIEICDAFGTRIRAATRNLSLSGVLVRLPFRCVYPHATVYVHFEHDSSPRNDSARFPATVVWTSGTIAGIEFDNRNAKELRTRWNIMLRHRSKRRQASPRHYPL